jgi:hypothetical protein
MVSEVDVLEVSHVCFGVQAADLFAFFFSQAETGHFLRTHSVLSDI